MILYLLPFFVVSALGAPVTTFDQRQDGQLNVRADLKNIVGFVLVPDIRDNTKDKEPVEVASLSEFPFDLYDLSQLGLKKSQPSKEGKDLEQPKEYDLDNVTDNEIPDVVSPEIRDSGLLLIGATEQCGPNSYRDSEGICHYTI